MRVTPPQNGPIRIAHVKWNNYVARVLQSEIGDKSGDPLAAGFGRPAVAQANALVASNFAWFAKLAEPRNGDSADVSNYTIDRSGSSGVSGSQCYYKGKINKIFKDAAVVANKSRIVADSNGVSLWQSAFAGGDLSERGRCDPTKGGNVFRQNGSIGLSGCSPYSDASGGWKQMINYYYSAHTTDVKPPPKPLVITHDGNTLHFNAKVYSKDGRRGFNVAWYVNLTRRQDVAAGRKTKPFHVVVANSRGQLPDYTLPAGTTWSEVVGAARNPVGCQKQKASAVTP